MPDPTLFDWQRAIGESRRDKGLARVTSRNSKFLAIMRAYAADYAAKHGRVTAGDVRAYADRIGVVPDHHNCWGGLFNTPQFRCIGTTTSNVPSRHAGIVRVWELT